MSLVVAQHPKTELASICLGIKTLSFGIVVDLGIRCLLKENAVALVRATTGILIGSCVGAPLWDKSVEFYKNMKGREKATFDPSITTEVCKILICASVIALKVYDLVEPFFRYFVSPPASKFFTAPIAMMGLIIPALILMRGFHENRSVIFEEGSKDLFQNKILLPYEEDKIFQALLRKRAPTTAQET